MNTRSLRTRIAALVPLVAIVIGGSRLAAHDMWIEPSTFVADGGRIVPLRLRVGQDMLGDPLARDSRLIDQFVVADAEGRKPVVGRDGGDPAGFVRAAVPGLLVVGYYSHPSAVELTAAKFNQYLQEEGLDQVAALRARRGETNAPVHEVFTRCAKSLLSAGPALTSPADRILGFRLELVAERNPYARGSGDALSFRLLYEQHPLQGALVVAMNRDNPGEKITARTDVNGRVTLRLHDDGMWLVKAVHMIAAPPGSGADWQSFWASSTFERRAAPGASR